MVKYEIIIYWSTEDHPFIAEVPELPGCAADGPTYREAFGGGVTYLSEHALAGKMILGKEISAHTFRHSWATHTLKRTKNLKGVSKYLGHTSTSTTADLYVHDELTPDDVL